MYAADFFFLGGGGSWEISTNFAEIVSVFCTYDYNNSWKFKIKYTLDHFHYVYRMIWIRVRRICSVCLAYFKA